MKKIHLPFFFIICLFFIEITGKSQVFDDNDQMSVDFGYAFSTPHRLCVSLPENSNKTLVDAYPNHIQLKWSYQSVLDFPLASYTSPNARWKLQIKPEMDGKTFATSSWHRVDSWLPVFEQVFEDSDVTTNVQVVGGKTAAIVRIEMQNNSNEPHKITIRCSGSGYNPSWVQSDWDNNVMLAGNYDRADRIIAIITGGEGRQAESSGSMTQDWVLNPGEKSYGWIVRPYESYFPQVNGLEKKDWGVEFEIAKVAWKNLIGRAAKVSIPDKKVQDAFYAGLADCFVMREPVKKGYIGGTPGTEKYRAVSSGEVVCVAVLLDQVGLHYEAESGFQVNLELQDISGNWADPQGWARLMWGMSGFKTLAIMEHFQLTRDTAFLDKIYPRMLASSLWQEKQRAKTRILVDGRKALTYGLMPRGLGDCGLVDGEDVYGVFLPHNIWTVYADSQTLLAAEILNKTSDIARLQQIHRKLCLICYVRLIWGQ